MSRVFLIIILLTFTHRFVAQNNEEVLRNLHETSLLLDSANKLLVSNPKLALKIANECKIISKGNNFNLAKSYRIIGAGNLYIGQYKLSEDGYLKALDYDILNKDTLNIIKDYRGVALVNGEVSNFEKSNKNLEIALTLATKSKVLKEVIVINESIGILNFYQKKYLKAINNYQAALTLSSTTEDSSSLFSIYYNLANVYAELNKEDLALHYYLKGRELATNQNNKYVEGSFYTSIGGVYFNMSKNDLAILNYEKSIESYLDCSYIKGLAYANVSLAIIYEELGDIKTSNIYAKKAYEYANSIEDNVVLSLYYNLLSKVSFAKKQYSKTIKNADIALSYAIKSKDILREKEALDFLYKAYDELDKPKIAYGYYKNYIVLKDSLKDIEAIAKIENIELKRSIEDAKKDAEIKRQKLQLTLEEERSLKTQIYLMISIAIILFIIIISLFIFRLSKINKEKLISEKNELLVVAENQTTLLNLEKEKEQKNILEKEINLKNNRIKQLVNNINNKNEILEEFSKEYIFQENNNLKKRFKKLIDSEEERNYFNQEIKQVDANFYLTLRERYSNLTANDLKLCSMLKMGLSSKEMATLLSISSSSVDVARSRLRKKIGISKEVNITSYLSNI